MITELLMGYYTSFWQFTVELLVAQYVFFINKPRRNRFWARTLACFLLYALYVMFVPSFINPKAGYGLSNLPGFIYNSFYCVIVFVLCIFFMYFCFETTKWNAIFYCTAAYCMQNLAYISFCFLNLVFIHTEWNNFAVQYPVMLAVYLLVFFLIRNLVKNDEYVNVNSREAIIIAIIALFVVVLASNFSYSIEMNQKGFLLHYTLSMLSCSLILCYQFSLCSRYAYIRRAETMENLWKSSRKHYELTKEQINVINVKCHDMKKQIAALLARYKVLENDKSIEELQRSIMIYESIAKTGNETLDVVLTEKSLYCEGHNIHFSYIADGSLFDFLSDVEIYSLFGNILDNAVEAVELLEEDKRVVSFIAKRENDHVHFCVENYFSGKLNFIDGLPQTTKNDKNYHGYGMQSIRQIITRHRGILNISTDGELFTLDVVFM